MKIASLAVFILAAQLAGFGQSKEAAIKHSSPLIIEEEIKSITISDNLDVVFVQNTQDNETVRVVSDNVNKVKAFMLDGSLVIATTKKRNPGERLVVYVYVNNLEELRLKGNAFATSYGVLHSENLQISISKDAKLMITSNGKMEVNSSGRYQLSQDDGYSYVTTQ
jgi:Putative auto-transporter adhesin, head GIN domain